MTVSVEVKPENGIEFSTKEKWELAVCARFSASKRYDEASIAHLKARSELDEADRREREAWQTLKGEMLKQVYEEVTSGRLKNIKAVKQYVEDRK